MRGGRIARDYPLKESYWVPRAAYYCTVPLQRHQAELGPYVRRCLLRVVLYSSNQSSAIVQVNGSGKGDG
jgi:hypothetical protein